MPRPGLRRAVAGGCGLMAAVFAQAQEPAQDAAPAPGRAHVHAAPHASSFRAVSVPVRARDYYQSFWGVEDLRVTQTASGNLIRFSWRVSDPQRARLLGDKQATPVLFGLRSHALLQIPVMDKIGQLRQTGLPQLGQEYWMVFSNAGNQVHPGDRVNVRIGAFHADGLRIE